MREDSPRLVARCSARPLPGASGEWQARVAALRRERGFWWLDSALPGAPLGRWSYAGSDPWATLRAWGSRVVVEVHRALHPALAPGRTEAWGDPLTVLSRWMPPRPDDSAPALPFVGGAVGVLGYELGAQLESVPRAGRDDLGLPDLCFLLVDRLLVFDHLAERGWAIGLGVDGDAEAALARAERAAGEMQARWSPRAETRDSRAAETLEGRESPSLRAPESPSLGVPELRPRSARIHPESDPAMPARLSGDFDAARYEKTIETVRHAIAEGDVYQVCLTRRLEAPFRGDPWRLYGTLRRLNPAPLAAYLDLPGATVLSSSPERFLEVRTDGWAESRPIKGTCPRGADSAADRAAQAALRDSPKDRAENVMIVDLVRNDLGRVCETGSVHVPELGAVERYATVFQLVSTVRGRLRPGCDAFDAIRATFPPGSMTGAPKLAAMEILARLEPVRRGFYAGALGFLDVRGGCSLSVVIRTLVLADGRAFVHTGGGIVADSDPALEWRETEDKARALLAALGQAATD